MFFSSIKNDILIDIFLLTVALIVSVFLWRKKKNIFVSIFSFSVLANFIFYTDINSTLYDVYNLKWIVKFTLWYWPYINIALFVILVINYIKNKK